MAAELLVDAPEQARPQAQRQVPGDPAQPVERLGPAALLDLALDGAPEEVEHLRDDDHRGHPVVAQRIEDDSRVAAAHVEDVGADIERVVEPDRLFEQVREREQRDDPVLHRGHDPVERLDRGDDVVVRERHALGRAGGPGGEDELEDLVGRRALPGRQARLPIGRERRVVRGRLRAQGLHRDRREVVEARLARVGGVAAGAEDEVAGIGCGDDALDRLRATSAGRAARARAVRPSRRSRRPRAPASMATTSGSGHLARGPARAAATPRSATAAAARGSSTRPWCRRRAAAPARHGRRSGRRRHRAGRAGSSC